MFLLLIGHEDGEGIKTIRYHAFIPNLLGVKCDVFCVHWAMKCSRISKENEKHSNLGRILPRDFKQGK